MSLGFGVVTVAVLSLLHGDMIIPFSLSDLSSAPHTFLLSLLYKVSSCILSCIDLQSAVICNQTSRERPSFKPVNPIVDGHATPQATAPTRLWEGPPKCRLEQFRVPRLPPSRVICRFSPSVVFCFVYPREYTLKVELPTASCPPW